MLTTEALRLIVDARATRRWSFPNGAAARKCCVAFTAWRSLRGSKRASPPGQFDLRGLLDEAAGEIIPEHELRARSTASRCGT